MFFPLYICFYDVNLSKMGCCLLNNDDFVINWFSSCVKYTLLLNLISRTETFVLGHLDAIDLLDSPGVLLRIQA
jgi:hypothetical protein